MKMKCGFYSPETHSVGGDHIDLHETNAEQLKFTEG